MERIAVLLTDYIIKKKAIVKEDYQIYRYGFLTGMELFICMVICYIIAIRMDMFTECTVFFGVFFPLRAFVGGLHMNSFKTCCFCSCSVEFLLLLAVKYHPIPKEISLCISILEIIILFFLTPVENSNRPVNEKEQLIFLQKIKQLLLIIFLIVILFYIKDYNKYLLTITYSLCIIILSMLLGKWKNKKENTP